MLVSGCYDIISCCKAEGKTFAQSTMSWPQIRFDIDPSFDSLVFSFECCLMITVLIACLRPKGHHQEILLQAGFGCTRCEVVHYTC